MAVVAGLSSTAGASKPAITCRSGVRSSTDMQGHLLCCGQGMPTNVESTKQAFYGFHAHHGPVHDCLHCMIMSCTVMKPMQVLMHPGQTDGSQQA